MKCACVFLFCFVYVTVTVSARGYSARMYNPLKATAPLNYVFEDSEQLVEYIDPRTPEIQRRLKAADRISSLPGQPAVRFSQYSGYVTVDPSAGRSLFYYFTESVRPSDKPLLLWLNGGPGCSSLGSGAYTELGPFRVNPDGKTLWHNKYAWNNVANVIFLESPAGVGFSYSNRSKDYYTGDKKTAADTHTFLLNWLSRFPEFENRDFYISGESYAGHFVSQLAALILKRNKKTFINLKGIAMGNAYIDSNDNARGVYYYYWTHALISDEIHHGISKNCNFSSVATKACAHYTNKADEAVTNVFLYNIYASLCLSSSDDEILDMKKQDITPSVSKEYDPCSDDYVYAYLNKPEVQKALHANSTGINGPWYSCSDVVVYKPRDMRATVIPTIKRLMRSDIRVWIFSGDTDSVVPITATRYSLAKIRAPVKTPWYPWYNRGEVGGYAVGYENLTFASVRGAGHFVPSYQPERALTLISFFLQGKLPPRSEH